MKYDIITSNLEANCKVVLDNICNMLLEENNIHLALFAFKGLCQFPVEEIFDEEYWKKFLIVSSTIERINEELVIKRLC